MHSSIAAISPHVVLRSIYASLLALIEMHTLSVLPVSEQPLPDCISQRHRLRNDLVEAIASRDRDLAQRLMAEHNTTDALRDP